MLVQVMDRLHEVVSYLIIVFIMYRPVHTFLPLDCDFTTRFRRYCIDSFRFPVLRLKRYLGDKYS